MAQIGRYCKAYPLRKLHEFSSWTESSQNLRRRKQEVDGKEVEVDGELSENDILYLQENYTVTDGIFIDENIIFDNLTPEWRDFCQNVLQFEIPSREPMIIESVQEGNRKSL